MFRSTQLKGCEANGTWKQGIGNCNIIANIRGGMSMMADFGTIIGFLGLVALKLIDYLQTLDCLGYIEIVQM